MRKLFLASAAVIALSSLSATAHAANTLNLTGNVPAICVVDVTNNNVFSVTDPSLQGVADLNVTCNTTGNKNLTVDAANGVFDGPGANDLDYTITLDLDGGLLPFNNVNLTSAAVSSPVGAPDAQMAQGLPGNFSVDLITTAIFAGNYTESWTFTVG